MTVRLNKFLAQAGVASRRDADQLISQGRVKLNGQTVDRLGIRVDETRDRVEVDGRPVSAARRLVYLLLHKPPGYLVTMRDPLGRPTIKKLLPGLPPGVVPVGRLDFASEGLLLLSNDGELAYRLTHPRFKIPKVYVVRVEGEVRAETESRIRRGVVLDGVPAVPDTVVVAERGPRHSRLRLKLHEGRKREVRRMLEAVGLRVLSLKRVSLAGLTLKGVPSGGWRPLTAKEVSSLKKMVGLAGPRPVPPE